MRPHEGSRNRGCLFVRSIRPTLTDLPHRQTICIWMMHVSLPYDIKGDRFVFKGNMARSIFARPFLIGDAFRPNKAPFLDGAGWQLSQRVFCLRARSPPDFGFLRVQMCSRTHVWLDLSEASGRKGSFVFLLHCWYANGGGYLIVFAWPFEIMVSGG